MDIPGTKVVELTVTLIKDIAGAMKSVKMIRTQRGLEDVIYALRDLYVSPEGIAGWLAAVEANGGKVTAVDQARLANALNASSGKVLAAFSRFDDFHTGTKEEFARMEFAEYKVLRRVLVGKSNVRGKLRELVERELMRDDEERVLSSAELAEMKASIDSLNADIESAHDSVVKRLKD